MLDIDNIISTSVSKAVEKIPTDEKDHCKCSFILLCTATAYKGQTNISVEIVVYLLGYIQCR